MKTPDNLTGEWTAAYVQHGLDRGGAALISNAHNAALAAEREVGGNTAIALAQQIAKLEDQLAAARKSIKEYEDYIEELDQIALEQRTRE